MNTKSIIVANLFLMSFMLFGCYKDKSDKLYPTIGVCDTTTVSYASTIAPILSKNCLDAGCHTAANPNGAIQLNDYANTILTVPNNKLINALRWTAGGSRNMPASGKINDCDINKVQAWINRGAKNN